jgi:FkbH-like protein
LWLNPVKGHCVNLIDALELFKLDVPEGNPSLRVFLGCGFSPLHLQTFLAAHLRKRLPQHRIQMAAGVFGDLAGNLERLSSSQFDAAAVVIEWEDLDPRLGIRSLGGWRSADLSDIIDSVTKMIGRIKRALAQISPSIPTVCCMPTLPLPPMFTPCPQQSSTYELQLRQLAATLAASMCEQPGARVVNSQTLDELSPPGERFDVKSEIVAGFPYKLAHASVIGELLAAMIHNQPPKKGLITDLDETLWSGILGETGVEGISWSLDEHTQMHGLYQQFLASLASAGILIGIASKNDPGLVEQAFDRKDLLLSRDDLFPLDVGWGRKSESVQRILNAWNIGPESAVFVDDSPMEIAEVKLAFPEMACVTFPSTDPQAIWGLLRDLRGFFGKSSVSEEDSIRLRSTRTAYTLRESLETPGTSVDEFLGSAKASIVFHIGRQAGDARAFELVNKTNQFNLNGKRLNEASWAAYLKDPDSFLITVSYADKYGPLGKIGVLMGTSKDEVLKVNVWVMSCRAFSRRIEHQCLKYLFEKFDAEEIVFDCQGTPRNGPLREFFSQLTDSPFSASLRISRTVFFEKAPLLSHRVEEIMNA